MFAFVLVGFIPIKDYVTHNKVSIPCRLLIKKIPLYNSGGVKIFLFLSSFLPVTFVMCPSYAKSIDMGFLGILGIIGEQTSRYLVGGWLIFHIQGNMDVFIEGLGVTLSSQREFTIAKL